MLIHKRTVAALKPAVGNPNYGAYGLAGYRVDPDGTVIATNGHMLLYTDQANTCLVGEYPTKPHGSASDDTLTDVGAVPADPGATIPAEALQTAAAAIKGKQYTDCYDHVAVMPNGSGCRLVAINGRQSTVSDSRAEYLNGTFPPWRKVLNDKPATVTVRLSAEILDGLVKAAKAVNGTSKAPSVVFEFTETGEVKGSIRVQVDSDQGLPVKGVIMPMIV